MVAQGYKQTEVGVIPDDWEVKTLGDCLFRNPDYGINAAAVPFDDTLPTYLRITDISEGKFISSNKVSVNNSLSSAFYLEEGDIVFARTGASVGKSYLYNINDGRLVFAGFLIRIKSNKQLVNPNFLIYLTQTKYYWDWVVGNSMRSGQPGLNSNEYKSFQIPLPPTLSEQTAIATALSDMDSLISSLDSLIAKKRNIKQGAMTTLLSPKEGWEVKRLGDCILKNPDYGINAAAVPFDDTLPTYLRITDISEGKFISSNKVSVNNILSSAFYLEGGDIVFARTGASVGKSYLYNIHDGKLVFAGCLIRIKTNKDLLNPNFLFYITQTKYYWDWVVGNSMRSGQPGLNSNEYKSFQIILPPTLDEQTRIATILSDIDNEIAALETKLEKYKQIKQGMMTNLLTGKIRLV